MRGGFGDVLEVGGLACEAHAVLGILLIFAPPEIRRVGDVGIGGIDDRQRFFRGTEDVRAAARARRVFERVAGLALGGVHADRHGIVTHARADQSHRRDHRFGARFAGEFPVGGLRVGDRADRFRDQRGGRFHRIRVGLQTRPRPPAVRWGRSGHVSSRCAPLQWTW